jgi:single-stranded-DNA-specific exonuclease
MPPKNWIEKPASLEIINTLTHELNISPLLAKLLVARKVSDAQHAQSYLSKSFKNLGEPYNFADMQKAVTRITQAILTGEHVGIFGDYDVDGVCSTALCEQFLLSVGATVSTTLPHRLTEGYGLSHSGVDRLRQAGATLLITTDCGILAHEQIDYANSLGFDVIVIDHHNTGDTLPNALAVVNPKRADCQSKADYLCAAGVSFFLCVALRRNLRENNYFAQSKEPDLRELLDLVALATVCDVVPLIKDNRALVSAGLKAIQEGKRPGLAALVQTCGVDAQKITSTNLGFHLGPRINAAGRLEDATYALTLLREKNHEEAFRLSQMLNNTNLERKEIETQTVEEACTLIDKLGEIPTALVLHNENWHPGVVGIVASRIAERYHRPSIIIGTKGKGSGRSIKGIDLHAMVSQASKSLQGFGGHAHAIGVTLGPAGVEIFRQDLLKVIGDQVPTSVYEKEIFYDTEINISQAKLSLIDELARLEPFGASNAYPVMRINRCFMRNLRKLNGGHLKGELETSSGFASFIAFRMDISDDLVSSALDVLAVVEKNEWQGRISVQLRLIDYKKSS